MAYTLSKNKSSSGHPQIPLLSTELKKRPITNQEGINFGNAEDKMTPSAQGGLIYAGSDGEMEFTVDHISNLNLS